MDKSESEPKAPDANDQRHIKVEEDVSEEPSKTPIPPLIPSSPTSHILSSPTLESFASYILSRKCKKIIVMSGAGISTSAGIPDFRTPGTGLYDNLQKYHLPYPEAIFELSYFLKRPYPFFTLAKELFPFSPTGDSRSKFTPTPSHYFIRLLSERGMLLRNYTQNIDMLERVAGIDEELLVEAHGTFHGGRCVGRRRRIRVKMNPATETTDGIHVEEDVSPSEEVSDSGSDDEVRVEDETLQRPPFKEIRIPSCGSEYSFEHIQSHLFSENPIPLCPCGGLIKPNITFFGENLPDRFHDLAPLDFSQCDALIVLGTSLKVHPFAGLVDLVPRHVPRLLINREMVGRFDFRTEASESLQKKRDVVHLSDCDGGVTRLAELLGLQDALRKLINSSVSHHDKSVQVSQDRTHSTPEQSNSSMTEIEKELQQLNIS